MNQPSNSPRGPAARMHEPSRLEEKEAQEHLQKLEALFSGGAASGAPMSSEAPSADRILISASASKPKVFANPRKSIGRAPSEFRMRLERLRIARSPDEIKVAADHFLEYHQLPDDPEVLVKVLQHPAERVLREAMGQLSSLIMQGRWSATYILEDRLNELSGTVEEDATKSYVEGLQAQLQSMKN